MSDPQNMRPGEDEAQVKSDLFSHPLALPAIAVTLGIGAASQVFGFWMGAMSGALQASRRLSDASAPLGGTAADEASLPKAPKPTVVKARTAVKKIISDASVAAGEATGVSGETTAKVIELRSARAAVPAAADDLKIISGVGPKLEQVLNKLGVSTYAQIAAWTDADVMRIEEHFGFPGRVSRDGWIDQAAKLLTGKKLG